MWNLKISNSHRLLNVVLDFKFGQLSFCTKLILKLSNPLCKKTLFQHPSKQKSVNNKDFEIPHFFCTPFNDYMVTPCMIACFISLYFMTSAQFGHQLFLTSLDKNSIINFYSQLGLSSEKPKIVLICQDLTFEL